MKVNRRKFFNQTLKTLSVGVVGGAVAGTIVVLNNKPNNDEGSGRFFPNGDVAEPKTDLDTLSCTLTDEFVNTPTDETLITTFAKQNNLDYTNDLRVERDDPEATTVRIITVPNSYYYEEDTYATVIWKHFTTKNWTSLYGSALVSHLAVFEDTEVGRNALLADLVATYPNLDMSQLYIDTDEFDQTSKSANIRVVEGSVVYDTAIRGTVTAGFVQASDLTYDIPTLTTAGTFATPLFKFKGTQIANSITRLTYSISPAVGGPVSFDTSSSSTKGRVTLSSNVNVNFSGALYTIAGTYTDQTTGNVYVSRSQVYVPPFTYDSGWTNLTMSSSYFSVLSSAYITASRRYGKVVTVLGALSSSGSSANDKIAFSLGADFRPSYGSTSWNTFPTTMQSNDGTAFRAGFVWERTTTGECYFEGVKEAASIYFNWSWIM